jgi:hypothetical protein
MPHPDKTVQGASELVAKDLDRILAYFVPGKNIAVVVWDDALPDQDFIMSNGDIAGAATAITRRLSDPVTKAGYDL